ncbi:hypothetical protein A4X03_0g7032, partial [Tilletia caries]
FLCLTAHWIDERWKLGNLLLDFAPFPVPHTAANAADLIRRALQELGIENKVSACVTDNTASAYNISKILGQHMAPASFFQGRCAAHLINLVVKHGLDDAGRDEIFNKCRTFVTYVHRSKPIEAVLIAACENAGIKYKIPPTVMDVRWNSILAQLLSLQRLEPALRIMFAERAHAESAWSEPVWVAIRDIVKILAVFRDVSEHLQGRSFPTMSTAAQGFVLMTQELKDLQASATLSTWGIEIIKLFQTRLTEYRHHMIDTNVVLWATILDPSMKAEVIVQDRVHRLYDVTSSMASHLEAHYPTPTQGSNQLLPTRPGNQPISGYQKRLQKFVAEKESTAIPPRKQLEMYMAEPTIATMSPSDALTFWAANEGRFPSLAAMARDILAIPATSVPSEAAFSRGGELVTKRRNRLAGSTVTAIMCLDS